VLVTDSIGDVRSYEANLSGVGPLDEASEVGERLIGFSLTLFVSGELDLQTPSYSEAVTREPSIGLHRR